MNATGVVLDLDAIDLGYDAACLFYESVNLGVAFLFLALVDTVNGPPAPFLPNTDPFSPLSKATVSIHFFVEATFFALAAARAPISDDAAFGGASNNAPLREALDEHILSAADSSSPIEKVVAVPFRQLDFL